MVKVFFKIVIPSYNNIAYLPQCLDSILNQTFQDFKIVLVDDQSTDLSYELAKSYERKYQDKLVVLRSETKRYAGGCRNIGIDYDLDCEYYMFADSDDYLYSNGALQTVFDSVADRPDMLLFNWGIDSNGEFKTRLFSDFSRYDCQLAQTPWNAAWTKTMRKSIMEKFLENCMRGEDTYQMLKIMDKTPTVKQIRDVIYVYRQAMTSVTHQPIFQQHAPVFADALKKLKQNVKTENVLKSIDRRLGT